MPVKRSIWLKETINRNYLINIIHQQEARAITPARAGVTAAEKRDSANLSIGLTKARSNFTILIKSRRYHADL